MKITTLLENKTTCDALRCEHGLSLYIETEKHKILFDSGASDAFWENAKALGIDLAQVDIAFLSHAHNDHCGGLLTFLRGNRTAKVYLQKEAFGDYYVVTPTKCAFIGLDPKLHEYADRFVMAEGVTKLDEELTLFSGIRTHELLSEANATLREKVGGDYPRDAFRHEQDLLVTEHGKTVLFAGCAHSGIINIITARKEFDGYNGSPNYNTGLDTRQQYGGASLSVQKGKFAASVQAFFFQMNRRNRPYTSESRRENFASEQQRYHTSESTGYGKGHNEYVTLNLSYQPDTLNLVTLEGSLWTGAWKNSSDTRIRMSDAAETPTVAYDTHDYDNYPYTGFQVGANYERRFRKPEHTLTVSDMVEIDPDKSYNLVTYDGVLNYPSSQLYKRHTSRSFTNTFQLDYYNPLAEHHYVEAGSKYIYRINKGYQNEIPWIDPVGFDPTNMTKYDDLRQRQQIFSLYFGYGLKFSKVSARAGVRMERTWNHADADNSREGIYDYGNRLLNFIPYLSFTYKPRDGHNLSLSYTERLRRPSISMLSTYLDDSDPYNTSQGNPDLEASTTHTLSLKYNYFSPKWSGTFTLSGHLSNDGISNWTSVDDQGVSHTTYSNNVRERTASVRLSVNYSPSEKFSFALNGRGGYSHYRLPQEEISTEEFTFDQNLNMNIALWKAATVSLGEGYNSGSANLGRKSGDYFYSYATLSQKFFDKKLQISVSCYNPFTKYQTYSSTAQTPTYRSQSRSRNHSRQFSIGAYWRFGKQNVQVRKTRKSISNDDMMDGGNKQGGKQ